MWKATYSTVSKNSSSRWIQHQNVQDIRHTLNKKDCTDFEYLRMTHLQIKRVKPRWDDIVQRFSRL